MPFFSNLANALKAPYQLQLDPAVQANLARQLLENSLKQSNQGTVSGYGTANKALQGWLARKQAAAQQQLLSQQEGRQTALAGALSRAQGGGPQAEAARRAALMISGGLPGNPLAEAILGEQAKNIFSPKAITTPLSEQEKAAIGIPKELFAQRNMSTGEIQIHNPPGPLVNVNTGPQFTPLTDAEKAALHIPKDAFAQRNANGQIEIHNAPPSAEKPPDDKVKTNQTLLNSMIDSESQIQEMKGQGGATDTSNIWQSILNGMPLTKAFTSESYKKYSAAGQRWAANLLYMKSGATANPDEVRSTWMQYFPQPGDGPDVIANKQAARLQEIESARQQWAPNTKPFSISQQPSAQQTLPSTNAKGWILHQDAQGNKAYVDPKNPSNFEEVK